MSRGMYMFNEKKKKTAKLFFQNDDFVFPAAVLYGSSSCSASLAGILRVCCCLVFVL